MKEEKKRKHPWLLQQRHKKSMKKYANQIKLIDEKLWNALADFCILKLQLSMETLAETK